MNWEHIKAIAIEMHRQLGVWYSYLVAASVALQASWADLDDYVPPKLRHWVIGTATVVVVADRMVMAARKVNGQ